MESTDTSTVQLLESLVEAWLAPALATAISVIYFFTAPKTQRLGPRLAASVHGVSIAALYVGSMSIHFWERADPALEMPFHVACTLPLVLIIVSFVYYRGRKFIHLLQIPNIACLVATWFVGTMAVTDNWL